MNYLIYILSAPLTGMIILMAGILMSREPKQSLRSAFIESLAWGSSSFLAFSTEILVFANS